MMYRLIDFGQEHLNAAGKVSAIEYDPNRNAFIALVLYQDQKSGYILACDKLAVGNTILCAPKTELKLGNRMELENIPVGTMVYNVELEPNKGGKMVRGAGNAAIVVAKEGGFAHLQLPSSEIRKVSEHCFASVGVVSNPEFQYQIIGKAGSVRLKGRRPKVRGTAMNPVDHPHGGGEGRTGRGMKSPKTKWGKPFFGIKTRGKRWTDKLIIQRRTKKKK